MDSSRKVNLTLIRHQTDTPGRSWSGTWAEFCHNLKSGAGLDPGSKDRRPGFHPWLSNLGGRRRDNILGGITTCCLEWDHETNASALDIIQRVSGFQSLVYPTWSSGQGSNGFRFRAILNIPADIPLETLEDHQRRSEQYFGGKVDPCCWRPHQPFFVPLRGVPVWTFEGPLWDPYEHQPRVRITRDMLEDLLRRQLRQRVNLGAAHHLRITTLRRILRSEPYAEPGNLDNASFSLATMVAKAYPDADPESLVELTKLSQDVTADSDPVRFREKIYRAYHKQSTDIPNVAPAIRRAWDTSDPGRATAMSPAEAAELRRTHAAGAENCWLVQVPKRLWVLGTDGYHAFPLGEAMAPAHNLLAASPLALVRESGAQKSVVDLVGEYGSVARQCLLTWEGRNEWRAPDGTFRESLVRVRGIQPIYHADVEQWLRAAFGESYPDVADWLSHAYRVDRSWGALCLVGDAGTGKTLFAMGVSQYYSVDAPGNMGLAMSLYNETLGTHPILFSDEQVPRDYMNRPMTEAFRELIGSGVHTVNRKFLPPQELKGFVRAIIAVNNEGRLADFLGDNHSQADINAIVERLVIARMSGSPPRDLVQRILAGALAEHALWLSANHTVRYPTERFGQRAVDVTRSPFALRLSLTGVRAHIVLLLLRWLRQPRAGVAQLRAGLVWVNADRMREDWHSYLAMVPPAPSTLQGALEMILLPGALRADGALWRAVDLGFLAEGAAQRGESLDDLLILCSGKLEAARLAQPDAKGKGKEK